MKNYINYLKFDLRISRKSMKYYVLIQSIFCFMFMLFGDYTFGMSYLFFFLIILATIPFSIQGNEKSTEMYYMFPTKVSSMVLGRFLYLICLTLVIFLESGLIMTYLHKINKIEDLQILITCLCGVASMIICFIQYPIYYKVGLEKGRIVSMIIYLVPAFIVFILPRCLMEENLFTNEKLQESQNFIILILFSLLTLIFIGYISYLISCRICKRKEV